MQLQPQSPLAHNSLGLSLAKAGRHDEAMPHYARAIALQPLLIDAYLNLAMSHVNRGQIGDAIAVVIRSIEARETPANRELLARLVSGFLLNQRQRTAAPHADARAGGRLDRADSLLADRDRADPP